MIIDIPTTGYTLGNVKDWPLPWQHPMNLLGMSSDVTVKYSVGA